MVRLALTLLLVQCALTTAFSVPCTARCARTAPRSAILRLGLFGFGGGNKKAAAPAPADSGLSTPVAAGSELAVGADHVDAVELTLTGGQRRKLDAQVKSRANNVATVVVAGAAGEFASEVNEHLANELVHCQFSTVSKKTDAMVLANEMAVLTGAAVAQCVGNVALLYRPVK